jgi:competence protein ComEC
MKDLFYSKIWKVAPFFRLLIPLIAGILLQFFLPISKYFAGLALVCSVLVIVFSLFIPLRIYFGLDWITGLAIHLAFLSLGRWLIIANQDIPVSAGNSRGGKGLLIARLENEPAGKPGSGSLKATALIEGLCRGRQYYREREKVLIYFQGGRPPENIRPGALIMFRKPLMPIENPVAPGSFDYKQYCRLKHIYSRVALKPADYALLGKEKENILSSLLSSWRKKLLEILRRYVPGNTEAGLLEALMIGYTGDLDRSLVQSYSDTGVVHIIAISGLHLALIYQILEALLKRIKGRKAGKWLRLVIVLGSLWIFSLLTGASPSVVRSAVMFSIILLARNLSRESVAINSLASSAFLLLCYEPLWLWDTGFQLSYMAVLSLLVFQKPIQGLLKIQNRMLSGLWKAASVSIAAQILTTPVCVYYFHRFPNYFLISNLLAVPMSGGILIGGILLCVFSFHPAMATCIGWLLGRGISLLNGYIEYIARLPGAITGRLAENGWQVAILYFQIYFIYRFLRSGNKKWLISWLVFFSLFLLARLLTLSGH